MDIECYVAIICGNFGGCKSIWFKTVVVVYYYLFVECNVNPVVCFFGNGGYILSREAGKRVCADNNCLDFQ